MKRRSNQNSKPIFAVILRDGDEWTVEAEWPDGTIDQVIMAKSASDAWDWINHLSESWVRDRGVVSSGAGIAGI
jgi:hypothetical protein